MLEQAPQFGEIGAGIQIAPNAWHALDALGVAQLVKKEAVFIERLLMMDGVTGEKVIDIPLDKRFARRFGNPYAVTHRADIHGSLVDGCKALPQLIDLRTNSRVAGFEIDARRDRHARERGTHRRRARWSAPTGGDRWCATRSSAIRCRPSTIHKCYRAVLNAGDVPKDLRWAAATLWAAHNTHIVHYPLRGWKLFNLVATVDRQADERGPRRGGDARGSAAAVRALLRQAAEAHAHAEDVHALDAALSRAGRQLDQRAGGAARRCGALMLQYMAQGAAMAMEDAVALGVACDATRRRLREGVPALPGDARWCAPRACRSPATA